MMEELLHHKGRLIGLYGGTFDPIHHAHLNLAFELMEHRGLSEVWFIPASIPPFKENSVKTSVEQRLEMVNLAISDIPEFHLLDLEKRRSGVSYTFDTVQEILKTDRKKTLLGEENKFFLLLGDDAIPALHQWHRIEELVELVPLLIGTRQGHQAVDCPKASERLRQAIQQGLMETSQLDICATEIRQRLYQRKYCKHLVPEKVLDYIYQNQLYYYI